MFLIFRYRYIAVCLSLVFALSIIFSFPSFSDENIEIDEPITQSKYIKWVEFDVPYSVLRKAIDVDIKSHNKENQIDYIELLAYLASKNGGNFKNHKDADMKKAIEFLNSNQPIENKTFSYYSEAYSAVLEGFVGEYEAEIKNQDGAIEKVLKYGVKVRHPIKGYFADCDDFGASRSYGFKRKHLGHDFMTSVGTNVVAVEEGVVEVLGWNQYGGWRIGIRSFDGKRSYYYAHLRKDNPYAKDLAVGQTVKAGQTIGYVGMTGYSTKENVNNIQVPHLHFGIQLIFDESQKEGNNQIWIDCYQISQLLRNPPPSIVISN